MAEFTLNAARRDWQPRGSTELNLHLKDSLEAGALPKSDVVVMNPPFIAWQTQDQEQRSRYNEALRGIKAPRGDLSMAFVTRAIEALNDGGVLGSLFPASLLSLEGADGWRQYLLENTQLKFLGSIGDYGLFSHALVQVACAVARKPLRQRAQEQTLALVTENDPDTTGNALRSLRKASHDRSSVPIAGEGWNLFPIARSALQDKATWRLIPPKTETALRRLVDAGLPTISDLFEVNRGVQTGYNSALLLTEDEWRVLPTSERKYFRVGTMTDSIEAGQVVKRYYVFFPYASNEPIFADEADVKHAVPRFFLSYLEPNKEKLQKRIDITRPHREDWWGLAYPRSFSINTTPRIISKYFSGVGGFLLDVDAAYLPIMGFAWFLRENQGIGLASSETENLQQPIIETLLSAYCAFFNTDVFMKLVEIYSPHVSGGQFDLSPRYVNHLPVPHLAELSTDLTRGRLVSELAGLGRHVDTTDERWRDQANRLVTSLYGSDVVAAL
jgi:hypothetical protein